MINKVKRYIVENDLLACGDHVLVALSGGADSVALFSVLLALKEDYNLTVGALHVHHGLRGEEADRDAEFCEQLTKQNHVPLHMLHADVRAYAASHKLGIEAAARDVRYAEFARLCETEGYTKVAVAHHAGDNAETVLMHLLRGSGLDGIRGILPKREKIIRPLLTVSRKEIEAYLQEKGLEYVTDSTNLEKDYLRNRIRHELIGEIERNYNPNFINTLSEMSYLLTRDSQYLNACAMAQYASVCTKTDIGIVIAPQAYAELPEAIAFRVMKQAVSTLLGRKTDISFDVIERCHKLCVSMSIGKRVELSSGYCASMEHDGFVLHRTQDDSDYYMELVIGERVRLPQADAYLTAQIVHELEKDTLCSVCFDYDKLSGPLVCRNRRAGDILSPSGMRGTKKLQDYFVDAKISRLHRETWPLVCVDNTVLWVCGKRKSSRYGADENTKNILKLTYEVK